MVFFYERLAIVSGDSMSIVRDSLIVTRVSPLLFSLLAIADIMETNSHQSNETFLPPRRKRKETDKGGMSNVVDCSDCGD